MCWKFSRFDMQDLFSLHMILQQMYILGAIRESIWEIINELLMLFTESCIAHVECICIFSSANEPLQVTSTPSSKPVCAGVLANHIPGEYSGGKIRREENKRMVLISPEQNLCIVTLPLWVNLFSHYICENAICVVYRFKGKVESPKSHRE